MRFASIDVLRGVAILGILFMNIPFHANIYLGYVPFEPMLLSDKLMNLFYSIFADGRFRSVFCILFGAGIAIQYESCKRKGIDSSIFLKSRLNWLLFFGVLHGVFIFGGDILMLYSVVGVVLVGGLSEDPDSLLKKARKLLTIGSALILIIAIVLMVFSDPSEKILRGSEQYIEDIALWQGNYGFQTLVNAGVSIGLLLLSPLTLFWQTLGLMYLGVYLYRTDFFSQGFSTATCIKILICSIVSTLLMIAPQLLIDDLSPEVLPLLSSVSAIFVGLLYAHIIVKVCQSHSRLVKVFANTGKVAFSLYILQSIVMGILLRWLIPDFALAASLVDYFLIALSYTLIQIVVANLYLRYYAQGPLETLWRTLYSRSVDKKLQAANIQSNTKELGQ
ncbi:DUF418 domain-containing protein [Paraglaciecola arctica]|uniref:DUF418 domain-containing protein n=1 Tax=Paraglaciecola arctica TaxID=1128911 RepID=UPI001C06BC2F|nr:DUF418 domain-containing protein [Paraglaciecola arctica]MBU3004050.1 DUF418 domain-containing protein [Paraglaciecola arctica]